MTHWFKRHWLLALVVTFVIWLVVCAGLIYSAYGNVKDGRDQISGLQASGNTDSLVSGEFETQLAQATSSMKSAHWKIGNPVVAPLRLVPFAGRQLSSAIALTNAVAVTGDTASDSLTRARALTDNLDSDRAGVLKELGTIAGDADARLVALDFGPDENLVAPLADARNEITAQVSRVHVGLSQASAGASAMGALLSDNSRYLLVAANNGEMRAGSGMFLSAGLLETGGGRLRLGDMETVGLLIAPSGSIQWPADMKARWGWIKNQNDMRNLMMSPRFDQSAPLAAEIWETKRPDIDGVMVIDPVLLKAILTATGPVKSGDLEVNADNVVSQLLVDQYRSINLSQSTIEAQANRRDALSGIARQTFTALDSGSWDPIAMARQLQTAAAGRHLMVWSKDQAINDRWLKAGVGGTLSTDSLMLNSMNVGSNKVDQYLNTTATLDQRLSAKGVEMTVKITVKNNAPNSAPGYVLGPTPGYGLQRGEYSGILSFSLPQDARDVRFDGDPVLVALGQDGPTQTVGTRLLVKQGTEKTMILRFTRAALARTTVIEASGRYPATEWTSGTEKWTDDSTHRLPIKSTN